MKRKNGAYGLPFPFFILFFLIINKLVVNSKNIYINYNRRATNGILQIFFLLQEMQASSKLILETLPAEDDGNNFQGQINSRV